MCQPCLDADLNKLLKNLLNNWGNLATNWVFNDTKRII